MPRAAQVLSSRRRVLSIDFNPAIFSCTISNRARACRLTDSHWLRWLTRSRKSLAISSSVKPSAWAFLTKRMTRTVSCAYKR